MRIVTCVAILISVITNQVHCFSTMEGNNSPIPEKMLTKRGNMMALSSTTTKIPNSTTSKSIHPKQIVKRIRDCGNDSNTALGILLESQPFLTTESRTGRQAPEYIFDAKPICIVINLLSKNNQFSVALGLLSTTIELHGQNLVPSYYLKEVYKSIIGMMAIQEQKEKLNLHRKILQLIQIDIPTNFGAAPSIDLYHAAISALGKCRQIDCILDILNSMETNKTMTITSENTGPCAVVHYNFPSPDRMAYLTALSGSVRCKAPDFSIEILNRMSSRGMKPDTVVYNHVLSSLANTKFEERYEMTKIIWKEMEEEKMCTDATYKSLISIFSKDNQYNEVAAVKEHMAIKAAGSSAPPTTVNNPLTPAYIKDLENLKKMDDAKRTWYRLGTIQTEALDSLPGKSVIFGIQQHKNPALNGLSLVFYTVEGEKLGFMLLRNHLDLRDISVANGERKAENDHILFSSIMGMKIDEHFRGQGLARVFTGLWIEICIRAGALPRSEKINKPLLSLALSNFGFIPTCDCKIDVEISRIDYSQTRMSAGITKKVGWEPQFALYSSKVLNFGERELRIQKMVVTQTPPDPRGKVTSVKTCFEHPMTIKARNGHDNGKECEELQGFVQKIWNGISEKSVTDTEKSNEVLFAVENNLLRRVVFGYLY